VSIHDWDIISKNSELGSTLLSVDAETGPFAAWYRLQPRLRTGKEHPHAHLGHCWWGSAVHKRGRARVYLWRTAWESRQWVACIMGS